MTDFASSGDKIRAGEGSDSDSQRFQVDCALDSCVTHANVLLQSSHDFSECDNKRHPCVFKHQ